MRAVVTGATGFIGGHLVRQLKTDGWDVVHLSLRADRGASVPGILARTVPDVVFHLAGLAHAHNLGTLNHVNVVLPAIIMDASGKLPQPPLVVLAGSAAEYGSVAMEDVPVHERVVCKPVSDCGISKYAQTQIAMSRARAGLPVVVARIWNPVGPRMPESLALGSFAAQIRNLPDAGGEIRVGNLDVERDFLDVREVARLLVGVASQRAGVEGCVYNICAGRAWRLRPLVEKLIKQSGRRQVSVRVDPSLLRPNEIPVLYGDNSRIRGLGLVPIMPDWDSIARGLIRT